MVCFSPPPHCRRLHAALGAIGVRWEGRKLKMAPMRAQISQNTERDRVLAAIKRCEAKRDAVIDPESRRYYVLCLIRWEAHLKRLG